MLPVTPSTMVSPAKRAAGARGVRLVVFTRLRRLGVVHDDAQVLLDLVRVFTAHVRQGQPFKLALPLRSEEHTSELQSRLHLVCRLLLEKKNRKHNSISRSQSRNF